ncbi:4-sulfomuconolactone hydrolase [Cercospora beticola]|uniref:4-sulfomuconolactone hydrolase n=2 Tax=Cercospora beticola TaxID=122368 RepID=A0A2G5I8H3_CERBT|nr:4-sulfomuconolactone hydrolase [Cercospora beticola]PIB01085.1 4-sulfomuconolactone hydrolase [Cercospora beticola]
MNLLKSITTASRCCLLAAPAVSGLRSVPIRALTMTRDNSTASAALKRLAARIPDGTWDTHMHVVDPVTFPLAPGAQYVPEAHTMEQATTFLDQLGIEKAVVVQPSIYGNDNGATLSGLHDLGTANGRAVVQFDPAVTSKEQLQAWHEAGVRGVRLNFKSVGADPSGAELEERLRTYADAVRPFGWALDLYIGVEKVPLLEKYINDLGVKVILAHYGHPSNETLSTAVSAEQVPGFDALVRVLQKGNVWVKLSGNYRLSRDPDNALVESLGRAVIRTRPDRCLFATDWPHTRFEDLDVAPFLGRVLDWIEAEGASVTQVLVDNAQTAFDAR